MTSTRKIKAQAPANKKIARGEDEEILSRVRLETRVKTAEKIRRDLIPKKGKGKSSSEE